jgi:hypothetical protein
MEVMAAQLAPGASPGRTLALPSDELTPVAYRKLLKDVKESEVWESGRDGDTEPHRSRTT